MTHEIRKPDRGYWVLWSALPDFGRWATAALLWSCGALLVLALAIRRHWER